MPLRWDPLLVRELARELDRSLAGSRLRALRLDGVSRRMTLLTREATLDWSLHPRRGAPILLPATGPAEGDLPLPGRLRRIRGEDDERVLVFEILPDRGRPPRDLVVELLGNQWNALVVERPSGTIRHVLVRRSGARPAQVGARYAAPAPSPREGASAPIPIERWHEILEPVPPPERGKELVARIAWTSPLNAAALVEGDPDPERALERGHALWSALAFGDLPPSPVLWDAGAQPYPWPLPGAEGTAVPSLLDVFRALARSGEGVEEVTETAHLPPGLLDALESAVEARARRATKLEAELGALEDDAALRFRGDLLLARLREVPEGAARVTIKGFDGADVTLDLDPTRSASENAADSYERAAKAARARKRLPALLEKVRSEAARLEALQARARAGDASAEEVRAALPAREVVAPAEGGPSLPYRVFRSSGGLEIRVGRGARFNDELTFRHSAPGDIWLHARHAAGAHVVLRWGKPGNPPHRDLEEAAVLAALHSKARTSGLVPVDWTLKKHVRKPRGSPPGTVVPDRVKTVMARPDEKLLERLAVG
jgi:hypothetical protein